MRWPPEGPSPSITEQGIVNSASFARGAVAPGEMVTFFATGAGLSTPRGFDGRLPAAGRWPAPDAELSAAFGGLPGEVQFKGEIYSGVLQVNLKVPAGAPVGNAVPLALTVGGVRSPAGPTPDRKSIRTSVSATLIARKPAARQPPAACALLQPAAESHAA